MDVNEVERNKINHKLQIQLIDKKKEHETYRKQYLIIKCTSKIQSTIKSEYIII